MPVKGKKGMPEPTLRRLTHYLHLLTHLRKKGITGISSPKIALELNLDATQVKKDIQYTEIVGRPKTGFDVDELIDSIKLCLDWNTHQDAFLVGVGNLGKAMLSYDFYYRYGLNIVSGFDIDEQLIGTSMHNIEILSVDTLVDLAGKLNVEIGVITCPASSAQAAADLLVAGGIKGIWNFAPRNLKVPDDVIVENAQFSQSLALLTRRLSEKRGTAE